jgi:hypothetical protein
MVISCQGTAATSQATNTNVTWRYTNLFPFILISSVTLHFTCQVAYLKQRKEISWQNSCGLTAVLRNCQKFYFRIIFGCREGTDYKKAGVWF